MERHEDRAEWGYEDNGPPLTTVARFLEWLDLLPVALDAGEGIFTPDSWPIWRTSAIDGSLRRLSPELAHVSTKVRYPADGMAYVFAPILHPDQAEAVIIAAEQEAYIHVYTLLLEDDEWRLHSVGKMLSPEELGKTAYSW